MPEIRAPIPKRVPKLVMPKSPAPWDITTALTAIEHDVYQALVKEPAEAAGITALPELPGPGTIASMLVAPLQGLLGGLPGVGQGGLPGFGGGTPGGQGEGAKTEYKMPGAEKKKEAPPAPTTKYKMVG